jgi:phospholipid/cholesterol/gamma-HCH transport system ATP-binding protein
VPEVDVSKWLHPAAVSASVTETCQQPLVQLRGVSKTFNGHAVLDKIDLDLYPNEALVIVGPSGTGKSTILRAICGLLEPDEGEILIAGQRTNGVGAANLPLQIGMVFQQAALFDSLTVEQNVGFMLFEHARLPKQKIRELVAQKLAMVGLDPAIARQMPAELSGGQRKRVSFARAIMEDPANPHDDPQLLLYDEPTAGLDPIASTLIEQLIRQLKDRGGCDSYVVVTHQQSTIRQTADRVVLLYAGKPRWQGKVEDIDTCTDPYVRQFFDGKTSGPIQ